MSGDKAVLENEKNITLAMVVSKVEKMPLSVIHVKKAKGKKCSHRLYADICWYCHPDKAPADWIEKQKQKAENANKAVEAYSWRGSHENWIIGDPPNTSQKMP